jgi:hypothetical protein
MTKCLTAWKCFGNKRFWIIQSIRQFVWWDWVRSRGPQSSRYSGEDPNCTNPNIREVGYSCTGLPGINPFIISITNDSVWKKQYLSYYIFYIQVTWITRRCGAVYILVTQAVNCVQGQANALVPVPLGIMTIPTRVYFFSEKLSQTSNHLREKAGFLWSN